LLSFMQLDIIAELSDQRCGKYQKTLRE